MKVKKIGIVISTMEETAIGKVKKFIYRKNGLFTDPTCETVELQDATIFYDPEQIEYIMNNFLIPDPKLEIVETTINVVKQINSKSEKYAVYAELSELLEKKSNVRYF
jgi:hypothetical protein